LNHLSSPFFMFCNLQFSIILFCDLEIALEVLQISIT